MALPELVPDARLAGLIAACETLCERDCCGIDAFHFSPLNAAAYLSRYSGAIATDDLQAILASLETLMAAASELPADGSGRVCSIAGTNQYFSHADLHAWHARVRRAITCAPLVLACSDTLENGQDRCDA